jgi:two-component system CheB/CheR fusion protein
MGAELARIAKRPLAARAVKRSAADSHALDQIGRLFVFIRAAFGIDLSNYKSATIERRIERRMTLHKISRLDDYVAYVQTNRDELTALYKDMLITVTSFFRDPEVFDALKSKVLSRAAPAHAAAGVTRLWVPACATGEEAYSLAILLARALRREGAGHRRSRSSAPIWMTNAIQFAAPRGLSGEHRAGRLRGSAQSLLHQEG